MASYIGNSPDLILKARQTSYRYVATSGQSIFSGADSNGFTMVNDLKNTKVFLNGVLLDVTDYTLYVDQVHLIEIATTGDIIEVITAPSFYTSDMYNKSEVDQKITNVIGTAGSALDTLGELSDALNDDANFAATVTTALGTKANQSTTYTKTEVDTAINPTNVSDKLNASTGYFDLPTGTTAQRPGSPVNGMIRYNTTINQYEFFQNSAWTQYTASYSVEYLVIAGGGGGGGGQYNGAGGGAGGYRSSVAGESSGGGASAESPLLVSSGSSYTVTVGAGGSGGVEGPGAGAGGNSSFATITSIGGGRGGNHNAPNSGGSGGSGGGGSQGGSASGAGTTGQGYKGGGSWYAAGAGGGGAGAAVPDGNNSVPYTGGTTPVSGGVGVASSITGTSVFRAGGGGGGGRQQYGIPQGSGGNGGGGNGGPTNGGNGFNGTANTGGGGGGVGSDADNSTTRTGGSGGSGIVILRYIGPQRGTGGSITSSGGYTIHTFTSSGTFTA